MTVHIGRVVSVPDTALSAHVHYEMRLSGITSQQPINRKPASTAIADVFDTWQGRGSVFGKLSQSLFLTAIVPAHF